MRAKMAKAGWRRVPVFRRHAAAVRLSDSLLHLRVESNTHVQPVVVVVIELDRGPQRLLAAASSSRLMASNVPCMQ